MPFETTDDYIVFLNAPFLSEDELAAELAFVAPPGVFELLRSRKLVGEAEDQGPH